MSLRIQFRVFSAKQYGRKRQGDFNIVSIIDLTFGEHYCMMCWLDETLDSK